MERRIKEVENKLRSDWSILGQVMNGHCWLYIGTLSQAFLAWLSKQGCGELPVAFQNLLTGQDGSH